MCVVDVNKIKIMIVHNEYAEYSGEEEVVDNIAELLKKNNHDVYEYKKYSSNIRNTVYDKCKALFSGIYNWSSVKEFEKILLTIKPDVIHIHNLFPLISPSILPVAKKYSIPIVMSVHNYRLICPNGLYLSHGKICQSCDNGKEYMCVVKNCENSYGKSLGYALRNWWSRVMQYYTDNIDQYLCLTNFQASKLIQQNYPKTKIKVLPNIPRATFNYEENNHVDDGFVLYVGRISDEKGIRNLMTVAKRTPDILYKVAGNVPDGYFSKEEVPSNVALLGFCDKSELNNLYNSCFFLVFPSICYEGFPTVIIDAMSAGKAIICSKIGGLPEIVEHLKNGLLFESGNVDELEKSIRYLINNPEICRSYGEYAKNNIKSKYNQDIYYEKLHTVYEQAISQSK